MNLDEINKVNEEIRELLKEPLYEMSMAWVDKKANKCVWVENPNTHINDYFKYLDSFSYKKADYIARISLTEPKYLQHRNADGKKNWVLTSKEKKELIKLMNSESLNHRGYTNWQATLIQYNFDNFYISFEDTKNGTFSKKEYPNAFDINTPMPNYLELK